jgi:hypothetical protein
MPITNNQSQLTGCVQQLWLQQSVAAITTPFSHPSYLKFTVLSISLTDLSINQPVPPQLLLPLRQNPPILRRRSIRHRLQLSPATPIHNFLQLLLLAPIEYTP